MHPRQSASQLIVYLDFKSPYAYLAKDPSWQLEADFDIAIDWRPLTLNIPSYLGSAKVNDAGRVVEENRTPRQWQGVRYAYMDAKRYARLKDIKVYGPKKIWDSSLASIGLLWMRSERAALRRYMDIVYERFWLRELDIEDREVVAQVIAEAGGDRAGFLDYLDGEGRAEHDRLQAALQPAGIFGVPTYVFEDEVFFGREHLPMVRWLLGGRQGPAPDIAYDRFEPPGDAP